MAEPATAQEPFETFVRAHASDLLRVAYLLTGDRLSAEDLVQDTLTHLYPQWFRVTSADVPLAYVRRCLTNDFLAGRRRKVLRLIEMVPDDVTSSQDVAGEVARRVTAVQLLGTLAERQRVAIVMRYFLGLPDAEIARHLGCREATVRSLISRGMSAMRSAADGAPIRAVDGRTLT